MDVPRLHFVHPSHNATIPTNIPPQPPTPYVAAHIAHPGRVRFHQGQFMTLVTPQPERAAAVEAGIPVPHAGPVTVVPPGTAFQGTQLSFNPLDAPHLQTPRATSSTYDPGVVAYHHLQGALPYSSYQGLVPYPQHQGLVPFHEHSRLHTFGQPIPPTTTPAPLATVPSIQSTSTLHSNVQWPYAWKNVYERERSFIISTYGSDACHRLGVKGGPTKGTLLGVLSLSAEDFDWFEMAFIAVDYTEGETSSPGSSTQQYIKYWETVCQFVFLHVLGFLKSGTPRFQDEEQLIRAAEEFAVTEWDTPIDRLINATTECDPDKNKTNHSGNILHSVFSTSGQKLPRDVTAFFFYSLVRIARRSLNHKANRARNNNGKSEKAPKRLSGSIGDQQLLQRLTMLEGKLDRVTLEVKEVKTNQLHVEEKVDVVSGKVEVVSSEMSSVKEKVDSVEGKVETLSNEQAVMTREQLAIKSTLAQVKQEQTELKQGQGKLQGTVDNVNDGIKLLLIDMQIRQQQCSKTSVNHDSSSPAVGQTVDVMSKPDTPKFIRRAKSRAKLGPMEV